MMYESMRAQLNEVITHLELTNSQKCKGGMTWVPCVTGEHLTHGPNEHISAKPYYILVTISS